jgi:hypothetical protein
MLCYEVRYKTDADTDSGYWPLGPHRSRDRALATFNSIYASKERLGAFTFNETGPFLPNYNLVERDERNVEQAMMPLYKVE